MIATASRGWRYEAIRRRYWTNVLHNPVPPLSKAEHQLVGIGSALNGYPLECPPFKPVRDNFTATSPSGWQYPLFKLEDIYLNRLLVITTNKKLSFFFQSRR